MGPSSLGEVWTLSRQIEVFALGHILHLVVTTEGASLEVLPYLPRSLLRGGLVGDEPPLTWPSAWSSLAGTTVGLLVDARQSLSSRGALHPNMVSSSWRSLIEVWFSLRSNSTHPRDRFN